MRETPRGIRAAQNTTDGGWASCRAGGWGQEADGFLDSFSEEATPKGSRGKCVPDEQ